MSERIAIFDSFVESTAATAGKLDFDSIDPEVLPVALQLVRVCEDAFLPNVSEQGVVKIPDCKKDSDGFAIIPFVQDGEVLYESPSMIRPTPARFTMMADASGVPLERFERSMDLAVAIADETEGWARPIKIGGRTLAYCCTSSQAYFRFDDQSVPSVGRPFLAISPTLVQRSPEAQGVAGIHEFLHLVDRNMLWPRPTYTPDTLDAMSATNEMRGYYLSDKGLDTVEESRQAQVESELGAAIRKKERFRQRNVNPRFPFRPTPKIVQTYIERNVIVSHVGVEVAWWEG